MNPPYIINIFPFNSSLKILHTASNCPDIVYTLSAQMIYAQIDTFIISNKGRHFSIISIENCLDFLLLLVGHIGLDPKSPYRHVLPNAIMNR